MARKHVIIFDLDETVIDSKHRQPNNPDGSLNLEKYIAMKCMESVLEDTPLPLMRAMQNLYRQGHYIVVCTARTINDCDLASFEKLGMPYHTILSRSDFDPKHWKRSDHDLKLTALRKLFNLKQFRDMPKIMFDDNGAVRNAIRQGLKIPVIHPDKIQNRLQ